MKATQQIGIGDPVVFETAEGTDDMTIVETQQLELRANRNNKLALSDNMIMVDTGLSDSVVTAWKTYRQSLRDLDFSDPTDMTWPTAP